MTNEENKQLASLVTYLLESEDWKKVYLSEYCEPIRIFLFKTGITFRVTMLYVDKALNKLLGPVYAQTQKQLYYKYHSSNDLYFKPKTLKQKKKPKGPCSSKGKSLTPRSEFGKLYLEHFGYGSSRDLKQYHRERKLYLHLGKPSWEVKK